MREYKHDTNQSVEYAYDHLGNRILEKDNRDTLHYTYNELNQLVQKKAFNGVSTYEYDKRGNRVLETSEHTQENRRTLEWDAANRLTGGTRGTDWSLYKSEYTYNGLGMRVNSTIEGPEHTVYDRDYLIDYVSPERNDLAEYNVGHYQWQGTKPVHELKYLYTADGQRLEVDALHYSQWGGSDTQYTLNIHEDVMGSAVAYTYQGGWNDGQWANKHEFDVWGYNSKSPTYNYDPMYRSTEPYFTGHQFDGSLNIYYADHRFYDAETGTWLSPDPIKDGLNWYAYCGNNPVTYVDPTGLWEEPVPSSHQQYKSPESIPNDIWSLMNAPIDSTWGISDSTAEAWFLSRNTAVIERYGLDATNIGAVTEAIKAAGVSPVFFYVYTVNEGGGAGGFINHYGKYYYAENGGDTAVNAASGDAQYLAELSKDMDRQPAWTDGVKGSRNYVDFVPKDIQDFGNADFASMPSGSIGRAYIPATAAATWEVYYPEGLLKDYNKVQDYGAPLEGVLSFIATMSKY